MSVNTVTHLNFNGDALAALEFYAHVFEGELVVVTYGQMGQPAEVAPADRVAWGQVVAANGFAVMGYDVAHTIDGTSTGGLLTPRTEQTTRIENGTTLTGSPFFLSVRGETADEIAPLWERLQVGATVIVEMGPSAWSPAYGLLRDRFGVTWMLDVAVAYNG